MISQKQQSSCPCRICPDGGIDFNQSYTHPITTTSISTTPGCELPPQFICTDRQSFKLNQQPPIKGSKLTFPYSSKINCINPNFGLDFATDFIKETNNKDKDCCKTLYKSLDSRLISTPHTPGFRTGLKFSKPVYTGEVPLGKIYDKNLTDYGQGYKSYDDIHAGQLRYYIQKDLTPVLFDPLFVMPSNVTSQLFEDPMSSRKFQTIRKPILTNNRNVSDYQFIRDQIKFRESIMHSQMAVPNQKDFNHVWGQDL